MTDLFTDADIDWERAATAFPDISLDGEGDIPTFSPPPPISPPAPAGPFDLDAFGSSARARNIKVTGHDDSDIEKFESVFPELDVPQVRLEKYPSKAVGCYVKHETRDADDSVAGDHLALCSTYIRCSPALCTTSSAVGSFRDSNFEPANRHRGARSHPVPLFFP
jgi:hypothetical protein